MKKLILYFFAFILIFFIVPAICTKTSSKTTSAETEENNQEITNDTPSNTNYDYSKFGTVKLLHAETGEVEELDIDNYLYNVVSAEMPATYAEEALKAQAVVARTYTIYQIIHNGSKHENADLCDSYKCCQAWISKEDRLNKWAEDVREENWNKIENAVNATKGQVITYNNEPINAFFHSNSGGTTEIPVNVWGGTGYPYLQSVETSGEDGYAQYYSEIEVTNEDVLKKLKSKYSDISIDFSKDDNIKILEYTNSGRAKTVKFGNTNISGVEVRKIFELKSTNFEIIKNKNSIKFNVKGYGHGVGMSQTGADNLAQNGNTYEDIIKHFYSGVEIKDINSL